LNKLKILEWANNLIEQYEEYGTTVIEETSNDIQYCLDQLKIECDDLREEIKDLVNIDFKFHVTNLVKVKLTQYGIKELNKRDEELCELADLKNFDRSLIESQLYKVDELIDEQGYFTIELWRLMNVFGSYLYESHDMVFESEIIFLNEKVSD
jgi:hypothetical protein